MYEQAIYICVYMYTQEVTPLCPILWDTMVCSLPDSSIHGIFQARILEWVAISFSRRSSQPRDWTQVSCIVGRRFTVWATREVIYVYTQAIKCFFRKFSLFFFKVTSSRAEEIKELPGGLVTTPEFALYKYLFGWDTSKLSKGCLKNGF